MGIEGYYEDYFDDRQEKEKLTNFQKITENIESFQSFICDNIPNCYQTCRFYQNIKCREAFKKWLESEVEE